jgi:hypothetical protein
MNKYFLLLFLFLFGCVNEQSVVIDDVPECELNNLTCFFNNIMNNHSSIVHFSSQTPIYDFYQYSKGYYKSNGCEEEKCVFEIYYYENEIYLSEEMNQELLELNYTQEEINNEIQIIQDTLNDNWEKNKIKCEMTREEVIIYLNEYLDSLEKEKNSTGTIGSKRCNLISK